jgi:hypothetical protein
VTAGTGISVTGTGTAPIVNIANTGVTAGTYTNAVFVVNAQGQITSATNTNTVAADWMTTIILGGSGTTNITASSLDAAYHNEIPADLNAATGVYTASIAGHYQISASVNSHAGGVGDFIENVEIAKTDGLATGKIIGWTNNPVLTGTTSPQYSVSVTTTLGIGDTVWAQVVAGGAVTYDAHVAMCYINGPFV